MATGKGLADPVPGSASAPASDNLDQDARLPGPLTETGDEELVDDQAEGHCETTAEDTVEDEQASPSVEISERTFGLDSGQDRRQDSSPEANAPSVPSSQDADNAHERDSEDGSVAEDTNRPAQLRSTRRSSRHTQGSTVRARGKGRGRRRSCDATSEDESDSLSDTGLRLGLRILQDLMNANSMFHLYPEVKKGMVDYHDIIEKPMWFLEIQRRFQNDEYPSIVDFVKDVRLLLLNTYRYFGPDALETRRALRIEHVFEMKLATLPKDLKNQCSLMSTHGIQSSTDEGNGHISRKSADFFSYLLESVAGDRAEREKNRTKILEEGRQLDREGRGKETLQWEVKVLLAPPNITQMRTMWEIPLIGHLLQLTVQILCIEQVPQYEVERMFLMPQASKTLAVLMTSLLSPPHQRPKLHLIPPMPYTIWSRKLSQRVAIWYKMFQARNRDWTKVFELCGIEKDFWAILGDWNQMEDYEFHELSFHQRVWLIKTLGDYLVHNHKTMQDALADHSQKEQNCEFLGEDRHGRQYLYFPQFCSAPGLSTCVRVYRCVIPEEKARSPDITEEISRVEMRTDRGNFLPTWMKSQAQGKSKSIKSKQARKKRLGAEINSRKFLSRIIYRMPNGMNIRGRRKRGTNRLADRSVNVQQEEEEFPKETSSSILDPSTPSDDQPTGCKDKIQLVDSESSGTLLLRQTRSSRKTSQGFYADWSDSDSLSTPSPSSSNSKSCLPSHSVSSSTKTSDSKSNCLRMKLRVCKKQSRGAHPKNSNESRCGISDDEKVYKAFDQDEDASSHESGCEEGGDRNSWSLRDSVKKEDDDSDEGGNNFRPENQEKEDCDASLGEDFSWISPDKELICKNKEKRPHFNPEWMLLGAEHFELVADSVQGVRDLVESLCEDDDDMDLSQRLKKRTRSCSTQPLCETNLEHRLAALISEIELLEVKMEKNTRQLRLKLFEEWKDFQNRPKDVTDDAESFWLSILEKGIENSIHVESSETKEEGLENNPINAANPEADAEKHDKQNVDIQDDDSQTGGEIRHSLRAKRTKVDNPGNAWLSSDSEDESSDDDEDDAWVMPGRRKKKSSAGRSRKNQKDTKSDDETENKANSKKVNDKSLGVAKNFSFESCGVKKEPSQADEETAQLFKESAKSKVNQKKMLPNKLTLDKEGNMFITLGCGTRVHLRKDEDGRIVVPEGHEGLSMISGKTLDQLLGSGKVVQNKKKNQSRPTKRSTTLFPASSQPTDIVQAKEWTPPVMNNAEPMKEMQKFQSGTSVQAKEWTPPLDKEFAPPLPVASSSSPIGPQLKTYANRKQIKEGNQKLVSSSKMAVVPLTKKASSPDEVVVLSDGSDDSIEVIKEAEAKSSNTSGVPRIESVIGNATDSFAPKPLTNSVTMTPVMKSSTNSSSSKVNSWSPVISNSISLEPVPSSGRVRSPGAPQVVITPAKNVVPRRNLQQTGVFNLPTPNQSFIPMNSIPLRQAQSQFVPVNQMVSVNNPFQPVAQVVGMGNQYVLASNPFPPMGNQYVMNTASTFQYVPVAPAPVPLPVSAFDVGLPPGLTGQIVLANGDNNQFSYAFKLDDGGLIFLSNEQVSRIRAANGGRLTTMVQFQTQ